MRFIAMLFGLWLAATSAFGQDSGAIEDVISSQLDAFNERDVDEAWQYAAPNIKRLFGNAGNFGMMVQQGYPMVWDNSDVRFLELREVQGNLWQQVMVRDPEGNLHVLDYLMVQASQGWQIGAVQLLPPPDLGV